jgi:hypothetical protein
MVSMITRLLSSCSKGSRDINEDVAGLGASDAEYKKVQVVLTSEIKRSLQIFAQIVPNACSYP